MSARHTFDNLPSAKQARITRIALEEFSRHGYRQTSINTIVKRLGIAKGSIFQYFGDKRGLFMFIFDMSLEKVKDFLRGVRDATEDEPFATRLEKTLKAGVRFINTHPVLYRLYLRAMFESQIPFRAELLAAIRTYSHEFLCSLLATARDRGEVRADNDLDAAGFVLDAVLDRFLQAQSIEHLDAGLGLYRIDEADAARWIAHITDLVCRGVSKGRDKGREGIKVIRDRDEEG